MFSQYYHELVEKSKEFHQDNKSWAGFSSLGYALHIKKLIEKHNCKTMLDYGCGKGRQYKEGSDFGDGQEITMDKFLGIESVYMFDPCWPEYDKLPPEGSKFDAVIMIQAIGFIPDDDMEYFKNLLMGYATKFCFIGELDPNIVPKAKKMAKAGEKHKEHFRVKRTEEWYRDQFKDWSGSELVFYFK